jgi:hypothetical protein
MTITEQIKHFLRPSNKTFIAVNALMGRFKHPLWVIGAGRSGTTWFCNLMCSQRKYRFLFEPFNSSHNPEADFLPRHFYLKPGEPHSRLNHLADKVFHNSYFPGLDSTNKHKLFVGLLVKDISANLFAYALHQAKPEIDLILIIRNPFAIALSRQNKPGWRWFNEPEKFLKQKTLTQDYLEPHKKLILEVSKTEDFIQKQILIWSVTHLIPLQQFNNDQLQIVFYEDLVRNTTSELQRLEASLRNNGISSQTTLTDSVKYQPSRTTDLSAIDLQKKSPADWQKHISTKQITRGNMILKQFGVDCLYDASGNPVIDPSDVLNTIQKKFD